MVFNCNSIEKNIKIIQKQAFREVIVKSSLEKNIVFSIKIANRLEIKNKALLNEFSFIKINYLYSDSLSKWANRNIELYKLNKEKLKRISNNKKKTVPSKGNLEYIYYTRHFIDSMKTTQQQFRPYIEKMLKENKDTLHIGTVADFKVKHKELFEKLTKNDSISIRFLDGEKMGERITVPVEW